MTAVRRLITIFVLSLTATALLAQDIPAERTVRTTEAVTAETDQDVNNPRALRLSLDEAIRTSMERNLGVQLQAFEYQESGQSLRGSYGIYDALASALLQEQSAERAVSSTIEAAAGRTVRLDLGVSQNLPTGGGYSFGVNNSRETSSGGVSTVSPRYAPSLNFSFNQPLLRDFGVDVTKRNITIARNTLGITQGAFRTVVMDTVHAVEQAYLDLVYARRNIEVVKEALFLARDQARITQIRIDVGASAPLDILQ
ncbi:MAG TPA: TolC family protein, partial [Thermoanaerobaculia bacterium]|nr:TolC family protein [Thermoanaerobaculia bacterium]